MSEWQAGRERATACALLAGVEAEWTGEPVGLAQELQQLAGFIAGLDVARQQLLTVRLRLAGAETYGYTDTDLEHAAADFAAARRLTEHTVAALAERLAQDTEGAPA